MNHNKYFLILPICIVFLFFTRNAFSLPVAINDCIASGTCGYGGANFAYSYDDSLIIGHNLIDIRDGTPTEKVLMEYQLGAASHADSVGFDYDTYQTLPHQSTNITGTLWLEVSRYYDLSSSLHEMTLYFDETSSQAPSIIWSNYYDNTTEHNLSITTNGLLSGTGEVFTQCCDDPYLDPYTPPSPFSQTAESNPGLFDSLGNWPLICVAEGCHAGALINLIGLEYSDMGWVALLNFNPDDSRSLIYYTATGYEGYTNTTYSVSAVPVPAAFWLFLSGLTSLAWFRRIKR